VESKTRFIPNPDKRLIECIRLRVKGVGFGQGQILVRDGKGGKDLVTVLPRQIHLPLERQIEKVRMLHHKDLVDGFGEVYLPSAPGRKYPRAGKTFEWQYVSPARKRSIDSISGKKCRYHVMKNGLQKVGTCSSQVAAISKRVGTHTLRHSFATHMPEHGIKIHALQELMGHADVKATAISTHVMRRDLKRLTSPLDRIMEDHATQ